MGSVVQFRRPDQGSKAKGKTLCRSGFHKWVTDKEQRFDVKQGRLVTLYRCSRCGATKNKAH